MSKESSKLLIPNYIAEEISSNNQGFDETVINQVKVVQKRCRKFSTGDRWDYILSRRTSV